MNVTSNKIVYIFKSICSINIEIEVLRLCRYIYAFVH